MAVRISNVAGAKGVDISLTEQTALSGLSDSAHSRSALPFGYRRRLTLESIDVSRALDPLPRLESQQLSRDHHCQHAIPRTAGS